MYPRLHILLNSRSGTAASVTTEGLATALRQTGREVDIDDDATLAMASRVARARESNADLIVAAGGDGTVAALAAALADTDKILAILPLGTVNAVAKDLGLPLVVDEWIARLDEMAPRKIDLAEVNGKLFLHMAVLGFIVGIAAGRERIRQSGIPAKLSFLNFLWRRLARAQQMAVQIVDADDKVTVARIKALAISNNELSDAAGPGLTRAAVDAGVLGLYLLKTSAATDLLRVTTGVLLGSWRQDNAVSVDASKSFTVRTRRTTLHVMLDGEIERLSSPLHFKVRPRALTVLAPRAKEG